MELSEKIINATIEEFNEKGLKFTMDDIAKRLRISKKTIYTVFKDKESLFLEMVDYCFCAIKASERLIIEDNSIDTVEKIKRIIIVIPERYTNIDLRQLYGLKEDYTEIYKKIKKRIESDWEPTIKLLEQGMEEGRIRHVSIPVIKTMVEATIEHFLSRSVLIDSNISYKVALNEMITIVMDGICK